MPRQWVGCKLIMASWLFFTVLIIGLCVVTIPIGCILAIIGSLMYFSITGTEKPYGGKYVSRIIYYIAFWAWIYDMLSFSVLLLGWVVLVFGVNDDYDYIVWDFRKSVGYFLAAQMCMIFVHAFATFVVYLKMRDCCKDIIQDEIEARERFKDMEKQIFEEFRRRRKQELAPQKKPKHKKTHHKHKHTSEHD